MKAVDTDLLVRWITRDDPGQVSAADAVMSGQVFIPLTVLIELVWVLSGKSIRMVRAELAHVLTKILKSPQSPYRPKRESAGRWNASQRELTSLT